MRYLIVFMLMFLGNYIYAFDFYDDFEGYNIGDDPADFGDWSLGENSGHYYVIDDGGDQIIESNFDGADEDFIFYLCEGAGDCLDVAVNCDIKYNGSECYFIISLRSSGSEHYFGGFNFIDSTTTSILIVYQPSGGDPIELYNGSAPTVSPDTWCNLKFTATGTDPVTLTVYLNDSQIAQVDDDTYLLGSGKTGFVNFYDNLEPTLWADDYNVDDYGDNAITHTSLGSIKSLF